MYNYLHYSKQRRHVPVGKNNKAVASSRKPSSTFSPTPRLLFLTTPCGILVPQLGSNLCPLQWEGEVLNTWPPGLGQILFFAFSQLSLHEAFDIPVSEGS